MRITIYENKSVKHHKPRSSLVIRTGSVFPCSGLLAYRYCNSCDDSFVILDFFGTWGWGLGGIPQGPGESSSNGGGACLVIPIRTFRVYITE